MGCRYNKNCVLYPRIWVDEINFCRYRCVVNDGPYTLLRMYTECFLHLFVDTLTLSIYALYFV